MRRTLAGRLLLGYALTVVAILALLAIVLDRMLVREFLEELTESLEARARTVRATLPQDAEALQAYVEGIGRQVGVRLTVVRTDGVVVADSSGDPAGFENHRDRPEIRVALAGRVGVDSRLSESVGRPYRYVALPPEGGLIVRAALPLSVVQQRLTTVRLVVAGGCTLAALLGVAALWAMAGRITAPLRSMTADVERMSRGDLTARVRDDGAAELALLGRTLNRMAEELGTRIDHVGRERQQLEQILSNMEEGVLLIDERHRVSFANVAAGRLVGPVSAGSSVPPVLRRLGEAPPGNGLTEEEIEVGIPPRTIVATAVPLRTPPATLLVLRDVTAARRVEAMRRDFVADASHELKTPAAAIQATAETVERAIPDDPQAALRFSGQLRREAERLARIVSDLLDLSRLETERPRFSDVRLDVLVREEADRMRAAAGAAGLDVDVEAAEVTVSGASEDLTLLVRNLLENAMRYTPAGGRVHVRVDRDDGRATVVVSDTGMGIPSRDLPRIFERFYRVDRARSRETGGTGLGLSIARHVAEQHGGRIEAHSELGRGSTFKVSLPLAGAADHPDGAR